MNGNFFHLAFVTVFLSFTAVRVYYQRQAQSTRGEVEYYEGKRFILVRLLIGIPFMLLLLVYMLRPSVLAWASFSLAPGWQWLGLVLGLVSIPLLLWVHLALGSNFSTTLHLRAEHTMVMNGPYRWVRHPMYTVIFIHLLAVLLLTANWLIGGVLLSSFFLILILRLRHEEDIMLQRFGEDYHRYQQHTKRFVPFFF